MRAPRLALAGAARAGEEGRRKLYEKLALPKDESVE